jgi:hypothetical protein
MTDDDPRRDQRILRVRLAAYAHQDDPEITRLRSERIERLSRDRFEDQVDPDRKLKPEERAARARSARRAYYTGLAFHSSRARAQRHGDADQ